MGSVFDIQRFCIHDGSGLRTTVFLKGCPLRCRWCSNPESQRPEPDMMYNAARCMRCGACVAACPDGLLSRRGDGEVALRREACRLCGGCEGVCPRLSIFRKGREMTVEEVVGEVAKDEAFFAGSGGGATLSGGEPFLQADFAQALFMAFRERGVHTAVETTAHVEWEAMARSLPYIDEVLVDVKHTDSATHREWTGVGTERIMRNIEALVRGHPNVLLRIPVIPGFNTNDAAFAGFADFAGGLDARVELMAYHSFGEGKYEMLGRSYPGADIDADAAAEATERLRGHLAERGVATSVSE